MMAAMDFNQLSGSLKTGLRPIYVIHGEEELLKIEALDQIRAAAKSSGYLKETYLVEQAQFDWQELWTQAASAGLFGDCKLLEIHIPNGKLGKQGSEMMQQFAEHPLTDTSVVIVLPKLDKTQLQSKWFAALAKHATILEMKAVTMAALPAWIRARLQQHDLKIDADALALFAQRVEGNLLATKQEIDKLALLYPSGYTISLADTEQTVANVARFDVFQLSGAWLGGDVQRVARLLGGLEAEGDEPVLLVWAVAEDVRMLVRLAAALKQGKTVQSVRNELRLWGDKQTLASKAVARISVTRLIAALQECAKIDRQIKGATDGDAWASLKHLVMNLAV